MSRTANKNQPDWKLAIDELNAYCERRGWTIEMSDDKDDEAVPHRLKIILNKKHKPEILYYYFLHELGHMLMVIDDINYPIKYKILAERSTWSQTYRISRVEEEIEAWNKGCDLALSFGLPLNKPKFEELKAKMVGSYLLWAMQRKHPHIHFSRNKEEEKPTSSTQESRQT